MVWIAKFRRRNQQPLQAQLIKTNDQGQVTESGCRELQQQALIAQEHSQALEDLQVNKDFRVPIKPHTKLIQPPNPYSLQLLVCKVLTQSVRISSRTITSCIPRALRSSKTAKTRTSNNFMPMEVSRSIVVLVTFRWLYLPHRLKSVLWSNNSTNKC